MGNFAPFFEMGDLGGGGGSSSKTSHVVAPSSDTLF